MKGKLSPEGEVIQHTVPLWSLHSKCLSTALKKMKRCCRDSFLRRLVSIWKWQGVERVA